MFSHFISILILIKFSGLPLLVHKPFKPLDRWQSNFYKHSKPLGNYCFEDHSNQCLIMEYFISQNVDSLRQSVAGSSYTLALFSSVNHPSVFSIFITFFWHLQSLLNILYSSQKSKTCYTGQEIALETWNLVLLESLEYLDSVYIPCWTMLPQPSPGSLPHTDWETSQDHSSSQYELGTLEYLGNPCGEVAASLWSDDPLAKQVHNFCELH